MHEPESEGEVFTHDLIELKITLDKKSALDAFKHIIGKLSDQEMESLDETLEDHVDDKCNFYMRLSKKEHKLMRQDPIQVKAKIAVYPARKENAIMELKEYLGR